MFLKDLKPGDEAMMVEKMDDDQVRYTHYRRGEHPTRFPNNVPVFRLRTTQGVPGEQPRYDVVNSRMIASEAHGMTPVVPREPWH